MKNLGYYILLLLTAIIVYQQFQLYRVKKELNKELQSQVDSLNLQINDLAKKDLSIIAKLKKAKKKDSLIDRRIRYFNYKLKKYEKITINSINHLQRDSIRAILKAH